MKKLIVTGLIAALVAGAAGAMSLQADPFETARYDIGIKKNAEALVIIDSGAFDINFQTEEGYSLLHYAADAGNLEMVKALLARGANPNLKTARGSTPYEMAGVALVKAELGRAMKAGTAPAPGQASAAGAPVQDASKGGNGICATVRAEKINDGRQPSMRPFLRAKDNVWYNQPEELALLLEDCVGANDKDQYGSTLLHIAADRDRVEAAKVLIAQGASKTIRDKDGKLPADYATSPEMKALLGPASPAKPATGAAASRKVECEQKYRADAALCSDSTCKMSANRRWQQCLNTGSYW
ncbi:ankyrin repeat domain-containing protein [Sphingomonas soli]|uniref:ankyrin repeat domain-containing protein n=1 Tax=Sphingomonas soli TaxID=266127 RepID=UPI00082D84E4|nr:ankyrin repeat domain-containing protein [Sphingomonas soli]